MVYFLKPRSQMLEHGYTYPDVGLEILPFKQRP